SRVLKIRSARAFSSATSASVRDWRPSNCFGRSRGVALVSRQEPRRSGCPYTVIASVHALFLSCFFVPALWPETGAGTMIAIAAAVNDAISRMFIRPPVLPAHDLVQSTAAVACEQRHPTETPPGGIGRPMLLASANEIHFWQAQ